MKNQPRQIPEPAIIDMHNNSISLHKLVNKLQASLLSKATARKSFIINDVDKSVSFSGKEDMLAYVIGSLLIHAVYSSKESCIRIETASVENQLQIRIRDNSKSAFVYSSYQHMLGTFMNDAKKLGGNIGLEAKEKSGITVVFSFAKNAA